MAFRQVQPDDQVQDQQEPVVDPEQQQEQAQVVLAVQGVSVVLEALEGSEVLVEPVRAVLVVSQMMVLMMGTIRLFPESQA